MGSRGRGPASARRVLRLRGLKVGRWNLFHRLGSLVGKAASEVETAEYRDLGGVCSLWPPWKALEYRAGWAFLDSWAGLAGVKATVKEVRSHPGWGCGA